MDFSTLKCSQESNDHFQVIKSMCNRFEFLFTGDLGEKRQDFWGFA